MKILYPNYATVVSADNENPNFPANNLLDDHPTKVWKGTTNSGVLTVSVASGAAGVALFNTNATTVETTITVNTAVTWGGTTTWSGGATWGGDAYAPPITEIYDLGESKQVWSEYYQKDASHTLTISLVTDADIIECGVVQAGPIYEFENPIYGINESLYDYSVVKELNNGAIYTRKKDVVKTFDFQINVTRDSDFYTFMRTIITELGPNPVAWRLTDKTNWDWVVYGRLRDMPASSHFSPDISSINVSIIEVL